uniref:Centromere protein P n=1 Tax=Chelydra serpentina TaxID=8475 RepID=A0A8C3SGU3_CHESE
MCHCTPCTPPPCVCAPYVALNPCSCPHVALHPPSQPLFELMIVWKIYVDAEGRVTPVLDLLPRIPVQALQHNKAAVENGPQCFRNMLLLLGIEASIESLIRSVGMEK